MKQKVLIFDVDGTLCEIGRAMAPEDIRLLQRLEQQGCRIALCSGKPVYYLCGFVRQIDLVDPILIGENGAAFRTGMELPPKAYYIYPYSEKAKRQIKALKEHLDQILPSSVWYQPNETQLTPFSRDIEVLNLIQEYVDAHPEEVSELDYFRHCDCYDFVPKGINKKNGLRYLAEQLNFSTEDFIAIGDGPNDIPMFELAPESILITKSIDHIDAGQFPAKKILQEMDITWRFSEIHEALLFLLDRFKAPSLPEENVDMDKQ